MNNNQGFSSSRLFKSLGVCFISGVVYISTLGCGGIINTVSGLAFIFSGLISGLWLYGAYNSWKNG